MSKRIIISKVSSELFVHILPRPSWAEWLAIIPFGPLWLLAEISIYLAIKQAEGYVLVFHILLALILTVFGGIMAIGMIRMIAGVEKIFIKDGIVTAVYKLWFFQKAKKFSVSDELKIEVKKFKFGRSGISSVLVITDQSTECHLATGGDYHDLENLASTLKQNLK